MLRSTDLPKDFVSDGERQWQARQDAFAATQSDFVTEIEAYQKQHYYLQQLCLHWEQERQLYQQEQERLWQDLKERRRLRGEDADPTHTEQYLRQMMQDFSASLASLRQRLISARQMFLDHLDALREQRVFVRELQDPLQRQRAYQQLQEQYQQVQDKLREARELLREQQETYHQVRLDFQAAQEQLLSEKAAIEHRQEERKWLGYGYPWTGREIMVAV